MRWLDRWQREVVLPDATWYGKILEDHPDLFGNESAIEQTVVVPDEVRFDVDRPEREVFYRFAILPPPNHRRYLKVVVAYETTEDGERLGWIVTAYPTFDIKPGERLRWRR